MQNSSKIQAHLSLEALFTILAFSTALFMLCTSFAQAANMGVAVDETASDDVSTARGIAYQVTAHPKEEQQPVIIQGDAKAAPLMAAEPGVEGFADRVPLSIAMQQVLPQGMNYTLGDGVNPGQLVSWRGGRPWRAVLKDMLAPSGLSYKAGKHMVTVTNTGGATTVISGGSSAPSAAATPLPAASAPTYVPMPAQPDNSMAMQSPPPYQPMSAQPMYAPQAYGAQPMYQPVYQPMGMQPGMQQQPMMMGSPYMGAPMMMGGPPMPFQNPALFAPQMWEAHPGQTLRTLLQSWCSRAGAELDWQAEFDYPVTASMNMTGTFEEAVRTLLAGFHTANPVPYGRLHYNPAAGQSILIVEASGNHYGD